MVVVAINQRCADSTVNIAMVVEYPTGLNSYSVQLDSFTVSGRRVRNCYVNSRSDLGERWKSTVGRYIVLELEPMMLTDGELPDCLVTQCRDIRRASGSVIPAWEKGIKPCCAQHSLGEGRLECQLQLEPEAPTLHFQFAIPYGYTPEKRYQMQVTFCREGRCQRSKDFSLFLYNFGPQGWDGVSDQSVLFFMAREVFHSMLCQYSISAEEVFVAGMQPERASRVLEAPFLLRESPDSGIRK